MSDLSGRTRRGIKWSLIDQVFRQVVNVIISAFLSRLLVPAEFGLLGIVTVSVGFFQVIKDLGLGSSIIHKQSVSQDEQSTIFWLNTYLGFAIAGLLVLLAPWIAEFFNEPRLVNLIRAISVNFIFNSMAIVPDSLILKAIDFKRFFYRNMATTIVSGLVAIWMAYHNFGVWALLAQSLLTSMGGLFFSFILIKWRPQFVFKRHLLKAHLHYSGPLLADSSINYWVRNLDNVLVGKILGPVSLGIYDRAYNLMLVPMRQVSSTLSRVMFPSFSQLQNDRSLIWSQYSKMMAFVALITFPLMAALGVYAREVILLIYGDQWLSVVPILQVFCFLGATQAVASLAGPVYYSTGKTVLLLRVGLVTKSIMILGIVSGLIFGGLMGIVWGYTFTSTVAFVVEAYFVSKVLDQKISTYFTNILPEIIAATGTLILLKAAYHLSMSFGQKINVYLVLVNFAAILIATGLYFFTLYKLRSQGLKSLISIYESRKAYTSSHDG